MEMNKMCDLENSDPNDVSRPSVSPTDRRSFLAGALALTLAAIPANVELAEAQAASGFSPSQTTSNVRVVSAYYAKADKKGAPGDFMRLPLTCLTGRLPRLAGVLEVVVACQPH